MSAPYYSSFPNNLNVVVPLSNIISLSLISWFPNVKFEYKKKDTCNTNVISIILDLFPKCSTATGRIFLVYFSIILHLLLSREFSQLQRQADHLRKEQARREGQKQGQEDQARHIQRELQSDLYSGTEARHKDMLAKLKVINKNNMA